MLGIVKHGLNNTIRLGETRFKTNQFVNLMRNKSLTVFGQSIFHLFTQLLNIFPEA